MDIKPREVDEYLTDQGKSPFATWLRKIKDKRATARILQRIDRIRLGNFGDCKAVGEGVSELRIHFGPGYRVYFGMVEDQLILLLCGGDKSSQFKDIALAQQYWKEYQSSAN